MSFHRNIHTGRFGSIVFTKDGESIKAAAEKKIKALEKKIDQRKGRIEKVCKERGLSAADIFANMEDLVAYTTSNSLRMTAGEQEQLKREGQLIAQEKTEVETLKLMTRNIDEDVNHELDFADLEYLGF